MSHTYQIELANRVRNGRAVGNEYVVTRRSLGMSGIVARFATREEAQEWISHAGTWGAAVLETGAL